VLFFAVLAMVTPPVALASYTAAGIARSNPNRTGLYAFLLATPTFLVPIAFVRDPAILFIGDWLDIALAATTLGCGAAAWIIMVSGYCGGVLSIVERVLFGAAAVLLIVAPFGTDGKLPMVGGFAAMLAWTLRGSLFGGQKPVPADKSVAADK
jgi:TRAP-type uncharacterized transport system fused permease subunit